MISFARTRDLALVRRAIASPRVYDASSDDAAPPRQEFRPNDHPGIWFVTAADDRGLIGLFTFVPLNAVLWEIHATRVFGRGAVEALAGAVDWFTAETRARRIVASIPATNRAAIRCALRAGFREYGRNPRSFLKSGELVDLVLVGISA